MHNLICCLFYSCSSHTYRESFHLQIMHNVCHLRCCKSDLLQFLIMCEHIFRGIVIHHFTTVPSQSTDPHIWRYPPYYGNQNNRQIRFLVQICNLIQNLVAPFGSNPAVGSSSTSTFGRIASTPAIATLRFALLRVQMVIDL